MFCLASQHHGRLHVKADLVTEMQYLGYRLILACTLELKDSYMCFNMTKTGPFVPSVQTVGE
jgi:hypothetical protein